MNLFFEKEFLLEYEFLPLLIESKIQKKIMSKRKESLSKMTKYIILSAAGMFCFVLGGILSLIDPLFGLPVGKELNSKQTIINNNATNNNNDIIKSNSRFPNKN